MLTKNLHHLIWIYYCIDRNPHFVKYISTCPKNVEVKSTFVIFRAFFECVVFVNYGFNEKKLCISFGKYNFCF